MNAFDIGFLHPGEMGVSLAVSAQESGHRSFWVAAGRSAQTRARADQHRLVDAGTLARCCQNCAVIVSCCPPHAAEEVAARVAEASFQGLYLDANAISPARAIRIGERMAEAGAQFVDGAIIGGPAWEQDETRLYLGGSAAARAVECFRGGRLKTTILGDRAGLASALKMCFASYSKGTTALICSALAAAERFGVRAELEEVWSADGSDFAEKARSRATRVTRKAWRFRGEMNEISEAFESVGLPGEFHRAAAEIYQRLTHFRGSPELPSLEQVLAALTLEETDRG